VLGNRKRDAGYQRFCPQVSCEHLCLVRAETGDTFASHELEKKGTSVD